MTEPVQRIRIAQLMDKVGACYAVSNEKFVAPNDPAESKPTYHVHPDRARPYQSAILRFPSLDDLEEYLLACKAYQEEPDKEKAVAAWERYRATAFERRFRA